jgi:hypothetical protein
MFFKHKALLVTIATTLALTACGGKSAEEKARDVSLSEDLDQNGAVMVMNARYAKNVADGEFQDGPGNTVNARFCADSLETSRYNPKGKYELGARDEGASPVALQALEAVGLVKLVRTEPDGWGRKPKGEKHVYELTETGKLQLLNGGSMKKWCAAEWKVKEVLSFTPPKKNAEGKLVSFIKVSSGLEPVPELLKQAEASKAAPLLALIESLRQFNGFADQEWALTFETTAEDQAGAVMGAAFSGKDVVDAAKGIKPSWHAEPM